MAQVHHKKCQPIFPFSVECFSTASCLISIAYVYLPAVLRRRSFYDPSLNASFNMSDVEAKWWSVGAEPIWVTNQLQKPKAQSGVFFWPGSEGEIKGVKPTFYRK